MSSIQLPALEDIRKGLMVAIHREADGVYVREAREGDRPAGVALRDYKRGDLVPLNR